MLWQRLTTLPSLAPVASATSVTDICTTSDPFLRKYSAIRAAVGGNVGRATRNLPSTVSIGAKCRAERLGSDGVGATLVSRLRARPGFLTWGLMSPAITVRLRVARVQGAQDVGYLARAHVDIGNTKPLRTEPVGLVVVTDHDGILSANVKQGERREIEHRLRLAEHAIPDRTGAGEQRRQQRPGIWNNRSIRARMGAVRVCHDQFGSAAERVSRDGQARMRNDRSRARMTISGRSPATSRPNDRA